MQKTMLMTILGPDRPGIVEELSTLVAEADGNWLESSMSHLAGHFAGMVQFSIPQLREAHLRSSLEALSSTGLECIVKDAAASGIERSACFSLEIVGHDRPGIVRAISDVIAQAGGNVEAFSSHVESAPMSGDMLFNARLNVCFPADVHVEGLDACFAEIGNELTLDVNWEPQNA